MKHYSLPQALSIILPRTILILILRVLPILIPRTLSFLLPRALSVLMLLAGLSLTARAQTPLDRTLSAEFRQQRLDRVLEALSHKGNFYFSYNSTLLKKDSLVTLSVKEQTLRQVLDLLFRGAIEYRESGNYIILRPAPVKTTPVIPQGSPEEKRYTVSGIILDETTGEKIGQASVYDEKGLISTLTNGNGSFIVKLKSRSGPAALTVSKEFYEDTTIALQSGRDQQITIILFPAEFTRRMITISPTDYLSPDSTRAEWPSDTSATRLLYRVKDPIQVEMTSFGKFLLSSRLRIQSLNIQKFFAKRSCQISFLPVLGTNGLLSPQITNNYSVNLLGGYTGGLKGIELGGLVNIDKRNVQGFQASGLFNVVGGSVRGIQLAGLDNVVLDSMKGFQAAGLINSARVSHGIQVSGLINYTHRLKGVQLGVINIADTSDGYSIGLINIVRTGMHQFSFFANEVSPLNMAFRSGNAKLYSIFLAGLYPGGYNKSYYYGFGLGHQFNFHRQWSLNPEISSEHLAPGSWNNFEHPSYINKLSLDLHWRPGRYFSLSAGPSLAIYYSDRTYTIKGQTYHPTHDAYPGFKISDQVSGWIGWRTSIDFL